VASTVTGALSRLGLAGSVVTDRRVAAEVDLLISRAAAIRLRITAQADGGSRSVEVILARAVLGTVGPGPTTYRVRLAAATARALRRAGRITVGVRVTLRAAGQAPRVLRVARRFRG
jgi:hypothetical protein